jgi:feruloyl-CoA synthase
MELCLSVQYSAVDLFATPNVELENRDDGSQILRSQIELQPYERTLIAERDGTGWREVSWGTALALSESIGQALIDRELGPDRPVMILSGNSIDHLLLTLGALSVGAPVMPVSTAYALASGDMSRIRRIAERCRPGLVYAQDGETFGPALTAMRDLVPTQIVSCRASSVQEAFDRLTATRASADVQRARDVVGPDSVAKILFTSGSTGEPKGVLNTHRMLCANQQQLAQIWPFLRDEPPTLVDWLPWSHTFGGNHNLNQVLAFGGTMYIDPGRPGPGAFDATVAALREVAPTAYYNVPAGWAMLAPMLERDAELRSMFFSRLRFMFYAAAALPEALWTWLRTLADKHAPREVPLTASWGCTESAPLATSAHFRSAPCGCIGVPVPGVDLKLVPAGEKLEVRLRGPNITSGYFEDEAATAAAFDREGFYRTGDAVRFTDVSDPAQGLVFDGRLAEDFKLLTGTWVRVGTLRTQLLSEVEILRDAVICGHDREYVAALAWLDAEATGRLLGGAINGLNDQRVREHIRRALRDLGPHGGSSSAVERLLLLDAPPSLVAGEITDKGYVSQRTVLRLRAEAVERLYAREPSADVIIASVQLRRGQAD